MPLKIEQIQGRRYLICRGTLFGKSIFESTKTCDPAAAESYRIKREREIWQESIHGKRSVVTFAAAATRYLTFEPRTLSTINAVDRLLGYFKQTPLDKITQDSLDGAYQALLENGLDAGPATKIRAVITPLQAILRHAAHLGLCNSPSFKKPKVAKTKVEILYPAQVDALILGASAHLKPLLTFLVGTGCRPSEAFELMSEAVDLKGGVCTVQQKQGDWRVVHLCPRVIAAIAPLLAKEQRVFKTPPLIDKHGAILVDAADYRTGDSESGQIKKAWATACRNAGLPGTTRVWRDRHNVKKSQFVPKHTPYVLRHTWASWHYCVNKDLLKLQDEGGWSEIKTVTGYAKLMPAGHKMDIEAWFAGGATDLKKEVS